MGKIALYNSALCVCKNFLRARGKYLKLSSKLSVSIPGTTVKPELSSAGGRGEEATNNENKNNSYWNTYQMVYI